MVKNDQHISYIAPHYKTERQTQPLPLPPKKVSKRQDRPWVEFMTNWEERVIKLIKKTRNQLNKNHSQTEKVSTTPSIENNDHSENIKSFANTPAIATHPRQKKNRSKTI